MVWSGDRTEFLGSNVTKEVKREVRRRARLAGLSMSTWVYQQLLKLLGKEETNEQR